LLGRQDRVTGTDHRQAIDFREALREILLGHTGEQVGSGTVRRFDAVVSRIPMRLRVDDTGWVRVAAAGEGFDAAQAELLARVYEAMEDGTWQRLKICADDTCRWAFFDHSKNHSGHWCNMAVCGNRAKVNAFRQRQAGSKPAGSKSARTKATRTKSAETKG
jgi:predicted RNA-binding Zn ribbon-like protein